MIIYSDIKRELINIHSFLKHNRHDHHQGNVQEVNSMCPTMHRGGPTYGPESLQVQCIVAWTLSRDRNDINALNL